MESNEYSSSKKITRVVYYLSTRGSPIMRPVTDNSPTNELSVS